MHEEGAYGANVAEALYDHGEVFHFSMILFAPGLECEEKAAAGSFVSAEGSADFEWFACDDAWLPFAGEGCVFVSDPCHDLAVGIDVWCRYVLVWSDDRINAAYVHACQSFEFTL